MEKAELSRRILEIFDDLTRASLSFVKVGVSVGISIPLTVLNVVKNQS